MSMFNHDFLRKAARHLENVDAQLATRFAGDFGGRQPIHTCYVPADKFHSQIVTEWANIARQAMHEHASSPETFAHAVGIDLQTVELWWSRLHKKLENEPIEDLRLDFEDGYGRRSDSEEDEHIDSALEGFAALGTAFRGIRIKSFESVTRDRGLRTLDRVIAGLMKLGGIPQGFVVTLPKVTFLEQVEVMVDACNELERIHALTENSLRFEVQIETTQAIISPEGRITAAPLIDAAKGRLTAFHYGTYDYSAAAGISAAYQTLDHPAADLAKSILQISAAGTGVRLSDGSTNIIPIGETDEVHAAWRNHYRLVRRALERGFYQGWDLHGTQIPTRIAANFAFYRDGLDAAAIRLRTYLDRAESSIMDEPATALTLANYFLRGLDAGAIDSDEIVGLTGESENFLRALVRRKGQLIAPDSRPI